MKEFSLILPLPGRHLSPNARVHYMDKARSVKNHRHAACYGARCVLDGKPPMWKKATIEFTFYYADKRRRDSDNLLASCKAYIDGLVDAGVLDDDEQITYLPVQKKIDPVNPRLVVKVMP